ncbi:Crossover junction endodeoxyribonuclease RuvC [subsurface metagenome]
MLVLGVDPGSLVTGYGLVKKEGGTLGYVAGGKISFPHPWPFHQRIHRIFSSLVEIIETYHPEEMSIEDIFFAKKR